MTLPDLDLSFWEASHPLPSFEALWSSQRRAVEVHVSGSAGVLDRTAPDGFLSGPLHVSS